MKHLWNVNCFVKEKNKNTSLIFFTKLLTKTQSVAEVESELIKIISPNRELDRISKIEYDSEIYNA